MTTEIVEKTRLELYRENIDRNILDIDEYIKRIKSTDEKNWCIHMCGFEVNSVMNVKYWEEKLKEEEEKSNGKI